MTPPLAVVMPVYNEAACLRETVEEWLAELRAVPGSLLLILDDGSRDETPAILEALRRPELRVIRQPNAGHGAAVLRGYREALALGAEWVFQADSDRQIPARHFHDFWARRSEAAFLQGRRSARQDPAARRWLSAAYRQLLVMLFGGAPRDPNIPFRLMRGDVLAGLLPALPERPFAPNVFLSLLALRAGLLADALPVTHLPRATGAASIHGWNTLRVAWRCARETWGFARGEYRRFALRG